MWKKRSNFSSLFARFIFIAVDWQLFRCCYFSWALALAEFWLDFFDSTYVMAHIRLKLNRKLLSVEWAPHAMEWKEEKAKEKERKSEKKSNQIDLERRQLETKFTLYFVCVQLTLMRSATLCVRMKCELSSLVEKCWWFHKSSSAAAATENLISQFMHAHDIDHFFISLTTINSNWVIDAD